MTQPSLSSWEAVLSPLPAPGTVPGYAKILLNLTAKTLQSRIFTYKIPAEYAETAQVGQPVLVSFGQQTEVPGFIVGISAEHETDAGIRLKELGEILDETPLFDAAYYSLLEWVSEYYVTPISQVLACALPANLVQRTRKVILPGPHLMNRSVLLRVKESQARKALELVDFLFRNTQPYEIWTQSNSPKGYTPRHLATQLRIPNRQLTLLLARLKTLGVVAQESEIRGRSAPKMIRMVYRIPPAAVSAATPIEETVQSAVPDFYTLDDTQAETLEQQRADASGRVPLSRRQREIVDFLDQREDGIALSQMLETLGTTLPTVKKLETMGYLTMDSVAEHRDPLGLLKRLHAYRSFTLSALQQKAVDAVMAGDNARPYLLYGVTGSGKTEVYMSLARQVLEQGRSVLVMVPEIALTSQIARRFIDHFGPENIALWHSNLSDGERVDTWKKLRSGEIPILIGARSAVWAPMQNIGLILIDEEHDGSYKQDSPAPRYNAKDVALELARRMNAKVVLGSATPEIATYYQAQQDGRILRLAERFGNRPMAQVQVVDMMRDRGAGNKSQISRALEDAMRENLAKGEQSIILLNRRGFYTIISCTDCGESFYCGNCAVTLTYHRSKDKLCCHYCGYEGPKPQFCPACASTQLSSSGVGTQRIEDEILQKIPEARVLRLDSDVMQRKNAHLEIFETFSTGDADILIGTQIVAKGLDVANITLVGVINADSSYVMPDFKSSERGFQLLTQVAGRAGRGDKAGRVIIQAIQTQHMVLKYATQQNYMGFYQEEILHRETLRFPPFAQLFRFIVSGENEAAALQYIQAAASHLRAIIQAAELSGSLTILGPSTPGIARIQNRYRFQMVIKNQAGPTGHALIADFYRRATEVNLGDLNFLIDPDCHTIL